MYNIITKEEKIFIIDTCLKNLNCEKYVFTNKINVDLSQESIAEINSEISFIDQKIQALEYEKINITQGE
jgi:hypothetical protein